MKKTAGWLSNTITPEAALYEFEENILPKIQDTKKLFSSRKIEDRELDQDIDEFYSKIDKMAHDLIRVWDKKLELVVH